MIFLKFFSNMNPQRKQKDLAQHKRDIVIYSVMSKIFTVDRND